MTKPLIVINIVGLTPALLGEHTPQLNALANDGIMLPMQGGVSCGHSNSAGHHVDRVVAC
ncbi:hypothetical protein [Photobacterium sp. TLY01]|uniref:hypothetical protein n=1 Tax=Photobacterium sp. TLY01 TaxID=2907534 RepID=UPI001F3ED4CA|nr:hypothetical protein [Photobacterium sp. TLY01]UIP30188.1 hypothetical protein LN341_15755 [Photobacterium sp. TLY01]